MQGAIGKLTLLKDKASEGVHKMRSKMGRNKDIKCRLHLKVTEQAHTCVGCAHVRPWYSRKPLNIPQTVFLEERNRRLRIFLET